MLKPKVSYSVVFVINGKPITFRHCHGLFFISPYTLLLLLISSLCCSEVLIFLVNVSFLWGWLRLAPAANLYCRLYKRKLCVCWGWLSVFQCLWVILPIFTLLRVWPVLENLYASCPDKGLRLLCMSCAAAAEEPCWCCCR